MSTDSWQRQDCHVVRILNSEAKYIASSSLLCTIKCWTLAMAIKCNRVQCSATTGAFLLFQSRKIWIWTLFGIFPVNVNMLLLKRPLQIRDGLRGLLLTYSWNCKYCVKLALCWEYLFSDCSFKGLFWCTRNSLVSSCQKIYLIAGAWRQTGMYSSPISFGLLARWVIFQFFNLGVDFCYAAKWSGGSSQWFFNVTRHLAK